MVLTQAPNPVGTPDLDIVQQYVAKLEAQWAEESALNPALPWWEFWKQPVVTHQCTLFLLEAVDIIVLDLDKLAMTGQDKKATALATLGMLYDNILVPLLPIWARPFASVGKSILIDSFISNMIDWMCKKYHSAVWPTPPALPAPAA